MLESDILIMGYQSILRYEGRNRLTCMVSDPSDQSPLVLAGGFSHMGRFRPLRMTIRGGADGLSSGRYVACFGTSGVILRYE